MAASGSELTSDEIINVICCVCAGENKTREGKTYCRDCREYFCSSCVRIHSHISSMKAHQIMDKGDFKSLGPDWSLPSYPTQRCAQHQLEVVTIYCKDHNEVACATCIALSLSHRSCKNIVSIPEEIGALYEGINLDDVKLKITNIIKSMEDIKKTKMAKTQELKAALDTEIEAVNAFRKELQDLLDEMEQKVIQELTREFSKIEESLVGEIHEAESLVSALNETTSQLKRAAGNKAQEFVIVKSSNRVTARGEELDRRQLTATDQTILFKPDHSIKTLLNQVKSLAQVSNNKKLGHVSVNRAEVSFNKAENLICSPKDSLYHVKQQREVVVKHADDKDTCSIRGSCITDDGCLLLTDYKNSNLKRIDMSKEQVKDYIVLEASPLGVCTVCTTEAAVAIDNMSVQFVSLGDMMAATRTFTINHKCHGLAHNAGKLFISDRYKAVYIYDLKGQPQHKISTSVSGEDIFQESDHIAVSACGDRVYVTDWYKGLVVLDSQGNYLYTHCDNKAGYFGICTDGRNILVTCYNSNSIAQLGHTFKMLGTFGNITSPVSLCFDQQMTILIANADDNNKITIFELE